MTQKKNTTPILVFFGTVKEVMRDCCGRCPPVPEEEQELHASMYVAGNASWITVNPGQQTAARIGSFHPITEGDWTEGAYISKEAEQLFLSINKDDAANVKECLSMGIDVLSRDSLGRSPLHVAVFCNAIEVTKVLLENGSRLSSKTADGRSALHIAAQYGNAKIVQLLIERIKDLKSQTSDEPMKDVEEEGDGENENEEEKGSEEEEEEDVKYSLKAIIEEKKKKKSF